MSGLQMHHHDAPHPHHHTLAASGEATVVLDIGGTVGALVVNTPEALGGVEIDLAPHDPPVTAVHTAVRPRDVGGRRWWAAVWPALDAGTYTILAPDGSPHTEVAVRGGEVVTTDW
jgi:hypothetical protein